MHIYGYAQLTRGSGLYVVCPYDGTIIHAHMGRRRVRSAVG